MKKHKKISIIMSLLILMSAIAVGPNVSATEKTYGTFDDFESGFRFTYMDSNLTTFRIESFVNLSDLPNNEYPEVINIPEKIGKAVPIAIDDYAFMEVPSTKVVIPDTITSIGSNSFTKSALTEVTIPSSIKTIDRYAFSNCSDLTKVTTTGNIEELGTNIFDSCSNLTDVNLAEGTKTIGNTMFKNCTSLSSIDIPSTVEKIDTNAFMNCSSMESMYIPETVTEIRPQSVGYVANHQTKEGFYITGKADTAAQDYAKANDIEFTEVTTLRLYGDVYQNNKIDISDVLTMSKALAKVTTLSKEDIKAADLNADNNFDIKDIMTLQSYLAKMVPVFEVGTSFVY